MPKRILLLCVVSLIAAGCGSAKSKSDSQQAASVMHRYLVALANADGPGACALLTPEAQKQFLTSLSVPKRSCAVEIPLLQRIFPPGEDAQLRAARVHVLSISGATASVEVLNGPTRSIFPLSKSASGWQLDAASEGPAQ